MKNQVKLNKNSKDDNWQDQLQPLLRSEFEFILSRPLESVIRGKSQFFMQQLVSLSDKAPIICVLEINVDVSSQCAVLP